MFTVSSWADTEIDDFVEASSELVQPLADFFDNVFVMVVCFGSE